MSGKYTLSQKGYDSSYESDGGTNFTPKETLGVGSSSRARRFQSLDGRKQLVVLNPTVIKGINSHELFKKELFFKLNYPSETTELFQGRDNYRMITPLVPGVPYNKLIFNFPDQQLKVLLSAVRALKQFHKKGYIFIDFKEDNILYDDYTNESYLVDGGLITAQDEVVCPMTFIQSTKTDVLTKRKEHYHIAPECWSQKEEVANTAMDVYSLGNMMGRIIGDNRDPHVAKIIQLCQDPIAANRPSLYSLELWFQAILTIRTFERVLGKLRTIKSVNEYKINLLSTLNELNKGNKLVVGYQIKGNTDLNFMDFYQAKYKDITQLADQRIEQIRVQRKRKREGKKEKEAIQKSDIISSNQANDMQFSIFSKKQGIMHMHSSKSPDIINTRMSASLKNNDVKSTQAGDGNCGGINGLLNSPIVSLPEEVCSKKVLPTTPPSYRFFESKINDDEGLSIAEPFFDEVGLDEWLQYLVPK